MGDGQSVLVMVKNQNASNVMDYRSFGCGRCDVVVNVRKVRREGGGYA